MATIQVADKPTLDQVLTYVKKSVGVTQQYSTIKMLSLYTENDTISITGSGKVIFCPLSSNHVAYLTKIKKIDDIDLSFTHNGTTTYFGAYEGMELTFNKNIVISPGNASSTALLVYLV